MIRFDRLNLALLREWLESLTAGSPALAFILFKNGGLKLASTEISDEVRELTASVKFLDEHGHETTADDVPQWSSSDEDVASVTAAEDGLSADVLIAGPGVALISVSSTNDDGSIAQAQGTLTVTPGDAVIGDVTFEEAAAPSEPPPVEEPPAEEPPAEELPA
jgi:hypothetical protein